MANETLPRDARLIALMLASSPAIHDAQPAVLQMLLEVAHRYTAQVLGDALVYADHAGRSSSIQMEDVTLAIQSRVGWEYGGRVPKEHLLALATKTNAEPLPSVQEVFGVRLPHAKYCLTQADFDLVPNKPPPGDVLLLSPASSSEDEEDEEEEEEAEVDEAMDEDDDDEDLELNKGADAGGIGIAGEGDGDGDTRMLSPSAAGAGGGTMSLSTLGLSTADNASTPAAEGDEDGSDSDDGPDGLFDDDGEDDDDEDEDGVAAPAVSAEVGASAGPQVGEKRKLDEDDEYD